MNYIVGGTIDFKLNFNLDMANIFTKAYCLK